jgi:LmbE family N-acetylglucosaminyl deacetylase
MNTMVIAPHPDDEVLGVGGTLLRRKSEGAKISWLIVTSMNSEFGWCGDNIKKRSDEIRLISKLFRFDSVYELNFPTTRLDQVAMCDLVAAISNVFNSFEPEEIFLPHPSDVHTDHKIVFEAASSCAKWFRHPSVKRILTYETVSETDFGLVQNQSFCPNVFIDIRPFLKEKLGAMDIYKSEMGSAPFPRSAEVIQALATIRGAASGFEAAEAFELLRERL